MPGRQMWLFDPPRPLRDRLGEAFFRGVPAQPGVYLMSGAATGGEGDRALYIGKAVNLRRRLGQHKNVNAARADRKSLRLVAAVERITWEVCGSEQAALLRENELLRLFRPYYNRVNVRPESAWYVEVKRVGERLELRRSGQAGADPDTFGAFKGAAGYGALLRALWVRLHPDRPSWEAPCRLFALRPPAHARFHLPRARRRAEAEHLLEELRQFLAGAADDLSACLVDSAGRLGPACPFEAAWRRGDAATLAGFFRLGPQRHRELRQRFGLAGTVIAPAELDDLRVLWRSASRPPGRMESAPRPQAPSPARLGATPESPLSRRAAHLNGPEVS